MSKPENNYMCRQFCSPDGQPPKCLLSGDRTLLVEASKQQSSFDQATLEFANKISYVCQLVARQLPRVDEFRD